LIGLYIDALHFEDQSSINRVLAAGLWGAAAAALASTFGADLIGRRRFLFLLGIVSALGTLAFAASTTVPALATAAFLGMLSAMGRDRGAGPILEQAILPSTTTDQERTFAFAWYNMLQDGGYGVGALLAAVPSFFQRRLALDEPSALRITLLACVATSVAGALLAVALSPTVERPTEHARPASPEGRRTLARICSLFFVDSFGGGFLATALISLWLHRRFEAPPWQVGALFIGARVMNALSHPAAAFLARRIGLVNTMVFTHLPSSLILIAMIFCPSFETAAVLFLLHSSLVEMDVPTRQSYVLSVVRPEERVLASGVTNLVRLSAWAIAPSIAAALPESVSPEHTIVFGATLKVVYDLALWVAFRRLRPPEERH
jgi:MFS family permease